LTILFDIRNKCLITYYLCLKLLLKSKAVIIMKNNIYILGMLGVIIAIFLIGIPITARAMSARPPVVSEQIEGDGYLQKSYIDSQKTLIYDKDGKVVGYTKKSYLDSRKTVVYDTDGNVKGYLQEDLMDSGKLRFIKE
jgi:hypothetical protein